MMRLKAACYCWTLKTGTLVIGWLTLISSLVIVLMATFVIKPILDGPSKYDSEYLGKAFSLLTLLVTYALMAISILTAVALLYGAYKEQSYFLLPYLISKAVLLVCITWMLIESALHGAALGHLLSWTFCAAGFAYFLVVVGSYYAEIRPQRNHMYADVVYTTTYTPDKPAESNAEESVVANTSSPLSQHVYHGLPTQQIDVHKTSKISVSLKNQDSDLVGQ